MLPPNLEAAEHGAIRRRLNAAARRSYHWLRVRLPRPLRAWARAILGTFGAEPIRLRRAVKRLLGAPDPQATAIRIQRARGAHLIKLLAPERTASTPLRPTEPVDVVVPIYNAYDAVVSCLRSVSAHTDIPARLIVVDDCSTDRRIGAFLEEWAGGARAGTALTEIVLLVNDANLGFPKSVNRALRLTRGHVVLLNSDTQVPPAWLSRLVRPLLSDPTIASATPFSNSATICSFPEFCRDNEPFRGLAVAECDRWFRDFGSEETVELPTGVGFCMALNRAALDRVGLLEDERFGRGYGEENDWCMRAHEAGFKNVLVQDLFVHHEHGASTPPAEKRARMQQNLDRVAELHPEYLPWVHRFIDADPPAGVRDTITAVADARTRRSAEKLTLIITHTLGGGTELFLDRLLAWHRDRVGKAAVLAYDVSENDYVFTYLGYDRPIRFRTATNLLRKSAFERLLRLLGTDRIFLNSLVGFPDAADALGPIAACGLPYSVAVHDYFAACVSWNLLDSRLQFCGAETDPAVCRRCLKSGAAEFTRFHGYRDIDIEDWRRRWAWLLGRAESVLCFSDDSVRWLRKYYPNLNNIQVAEHFVERPADGAPAGASVDGTLQVSVLGAIGPCKGAAIVRAVVAQVRRERLPIRITIVGYLMDDLYPRQTRDGRLAITGPYRPAALPLLLAESRTDVVLIPSIWPETFSFTAAEATALGYPVVTFPLGAQAERIRSAGAGVVLPEISAQAVVDCLKSLAEDRARLAVLRQRAAATTLPDAAEFNRALDRLFKS